MNTVGVQLNIMKMKHSYFCTLLACVILPGSAVASGTYNARPPRPPKVEGDGRSIAERDKYALGKKVFTRKADKLAVQPQANREAQQKRLAELQARLPASTQKKVNLPALAGKLTAEELDALQYYVSKRYPSN